MVAKSQATAACDRRNCDQVTADRTGAGSTAALLRRRLDATCFGSLSCRCRSDRGSTPCACHVRYEAVAVTVFAGSDCSYFGCGQVVHGCRSFVPTKNVGSNDTSVQGVCYAPACFCWFCWGFELSWDLLERPVRMYLLVASLE